MRITFEALRAGHGDCLLLRYGPEEDERVVLIDGGPAGTWRRALEPRLAQLRGDRDVLSLRLLMVSHIDDDHVAGVVDLLAALRERAQPDVAIEAAWFNAFELLTDAQGRDGAAQAQAAASALAASAPGGESVAVVASVSQGVAIRDDLAALGIPLNPEFDALVVADAGTPTICAVDELLDLEILGPSAAAVDDLREKWTEWERAHQEKADAQTAAYLDRSVFNLSSIVVLARVGDRRLLLTGDARGDAVIAALRDRGHLPDGRLEVDLFKLPHHGSVRNVDADLFAAVRARHYVVSADGRHGNPEDETLTLLCDSRAGDNEPWTLWLTYGGAPGDGRDGLPERYARFFAARAKDGQTVDVRYGRDGEPLAVEL